VRLLHFEQGSIFPGDYRAINAAVISPSGGPFAHTLAIEAGSSSGVRLDSPVVSGDGLVGIVSNVFPDTAVVRLLADPDSFVAARDVDTQVRGMIHTGPGGTLILDQVLKQREVKDGDKLVTAGTHNAQYPDLYPYGIPIGTVTSVSATDTATYLQVQVQPFADLGSLEAVAVLVPKKPRR
jgi:rod shape-determining protein MreC